MSALPGTPQLESRTIDYLEGLMEGFVAYDENWVLTYINSSGEELIGVRRAEVVGKTWHQAFPHAVGNPVDQMYQRVMRSRQAERMEIEYAHYGRRWFEISASPVRSGGISVHFRDITDKHDSDLRFRLLADSAPVLIWVNGAAGCEYVNRTYLEFFGATEAEVRGYDWTRFVHPEDRDRYFADYVRVTREGRRYEGNVRLRRHDGVYRWMRTIGLPRTDASGAIVGDAGCAVDFTAVREAGEQLREADRRKDEFIATLAHELRNPLAPLRSALELLRLQGPAAATHVRELMERQVGHLVRLVDDLLEVSRISSGQLELRRDRVELAEALRNAIETSRPLIDEAGHRLEVALPQEPLWLEGDGVRLAQIFANLLNNAARFTPHGGSIALHAERVGARACIRVRDSGAGFTPEQRARLFEMFSRGDHSSGLGIGLALVRRLTQLHGGTVEARSEGEGRGAEFTVTLPIAALPARERPPAPARAADAAPGTCRVVVADDNRDAAESLAMLLRTLGNEVALAYDGEEAVQVVRAFHPQLALIDIGMPGLNGYEAAREIRNDARLRGVRLVALTGWGQDADRRLAREAGFDDHLVKPAELAALRAVLGAVAPGASL